MNKKNGTLSNSLIKYSSLILHLLQEPDKMLQIVNRLLRSSDRIKFIKTMVVYTTFISLGLNIAIPGPTILDLQHQVEQNTTIEQITLILPARSGGYALGAITSE